MREVVIDRLAVSETRDWRASCHAFGRGIITTVLAMPHLVEVVTNIIGVWSLITSNLKEPRSRDDGESLVVRSFSSVNSMALVVACLLCPNCLERHGLVILHGPDGAKKLSLVSYAGYYLYVY